MIRLAQRIFVANVVAFIWLACPIQAQTAYWYVDNSVSANGNGASWGSAWKNFSDIIWGGTNGVSPGDTLYISGGSDSQVYYETLAPGSSGVEGNRITINVGANSPNPAGHDGMVIIDGGGTRTPGISITGKNYITVNGSKNSVYKLLIRNINNGSAVVVRSSNYTTIQYLKVENGTSRGIRVDGYGSPATHNTIRGNDIRTGYVDNAIQTDGIYTQYGQDTIIENNTVVIGNNGPSHNDAIQTANGEKRFTIRNNWFEWADNRGNADDQVCMMEGIQEWLHFYNNVAIGSQLLPWQVCLLYSKQSGYAAVHYFWNNTFVSKSSTTIPLIVLTSPVPGNSLGAVKNNIFYSAGTVGLYVDQVASADDIDNNLYYLTSGTSVSRIGGVNRSWASHHAIYDIHGLYANPNFNPADEYRLSAGSPAINSGTDIRPYFSTDRDGITRPVGSAWDIGAYEYGGIPSSPFPTATHPPITPGNTTATRTPTRTRTPTPTPGVGFPGDLNNDSHVDIFDYNILVQNFGRTGSPGFTPADINTDGSVDIFDYNILVGNFGT